MEHVTIEQQIRSQIYRAFEHLGADRELLKLLGTIGSWGGTLDDEEVLSLLREWLTRYVTQIANYRFAEVEGRRSPLFARRLTWAGLNVGCSRLFDESRTFPPN